eukprot:COSAG05_NODE_354_length_10862_cov_59.954659_7_plen_79_part_00
MNFVEAEKKFPPSSHFVPGQAAAGQYELLCLLYLCPLVPAAAWSPVIRTSSTPRFSPWILALGIHRESNCQSVEVLVP